ncbi:MAG TPA: carboxypeptidase regulatory-like domain-containing protein [Bryobacteraceae bacterium]
MIRFMFLALALAVAAWAQGARGGSVQGTVKDDTGGIIPGAAVTLANDSGTVQTTKAAGDGTYTFHGVPPGTYSVTATYKGLQQATVLVVSVTAGQAASGNIVMRPQAQKEEVTVSASSEDTTVSTEPANNASALVLGKEDLDSLPDDPDDLQADLQALAGPAAGPGGNEVYIDGFTGGRLPPKDSIREIRINSNPFSAEFSKLGYGRIQIFTKPGSDKFHGRAYYNISDGVWNSRNPFLSVNPPFRTQLFGGNVSGPINKTASFFLDIERRNIDDNGTITATIPTSGFLSGRSNQTFFPTPQRRTTISPRADFQLGKNNTLSVRYGYLINDHPVTGITAFNLPDTTVDNIHFPSSGYSSSVTEQSVNLVDTAVLSPKAINETRFQFERENSFLASLSSAPGLYVSQSFVSGGSGYSAPGFPSSYSLENQYELQNYTSLTWGAHTTKFGIRFRANVLDDASPKDFNGTYQFLGGMFPALDSNLQLIPGVDAKLRSIDQYLLTVRLLNSGKSSADVTGMGYGPSKYTVNAGAPYIGLHQMDFGPFIQDDWRVLPNLTISLGARFEAQTNIHDHFDVAPRFGFAWSPDGKSGGGRSKTVVRGGWGIFYDRFGISNVETALRYNTGNQVTYTLNNPAIYDAAFDTPIPLSALSSAHVDAAQRYQIDSTLRAPQLMQTAIGVERQLFGKTRLSVNLMNTRGVHLLRTRNINAPLPIIGDLPPGALGGLSLGRPYGNIGDIFNYESDGGLKQTMVLVNVNSQVGRWLTLFGRYSHNDAHGDTDGLGSLPANPYNLAADWGRSRISIAHNFFLGGSIMAKWGVRFSPFIVAHTGTPFNITTGTDLYLQGQGAATARPSTTGNVEPYETQNGTFYFDPAPLVAAPGTSNMVERNSGTGAGYVGINLRVSRTWGFGATKFSGVSGGSRGGGGGGGRHGGGGGFGGGGRRGGFGSESTEHRYNVTVSINARNILNHANLNTFNGSLTSPYFYEATGITGGFGAEQTASNQRRIDLQLRFAF